MYFVHFPFLHKINLFKINFKNCISELEICPIYMLLTKIFSRYQNDLPKKIKSRGKDAHLVHEELVQTIKWKLAVSLKGFFGSGK